MDYKIKNLPKSLVEITITVSPEILEEAKKLSLEEISKEMNIKGFRPGHVPSNIVEQHVDQQHILAHTQEIAIQKSYADVVIKEKIQVVSRPKIKIEKDEPLTYTAEVAVMPETKIDDYKSIKVPKKEVKVTEKDIEEVMKDMKKYSTTYKDADREAKTGDRVEVDFQGYDEKGQEVANTKSVNHPVIIGDGTLIPGFEDNLIGLKKGDKKEFDLKFPKEYKVKDFQEKTLKFKVELKRVEEPIIPEINEAFIEKMTGKKQTVEEFKKEIEENIKITEENKAKQKRENDYLEELLKKVKVEIPDVLIEEEAEFILQDVKDDISVKGLQFEKFLEQAKITEEDLKKKYRPEAEKRIKIRLALQYLIKEEKITVSDEELNQEFEKIKGHYPKNEQSSIEKEYKEGNLKIQLFNKIALKKLFEGLLV